MNEGQRKMLRDIVTTLEGLKDMVEGHAEAEEEKYENLSEGLREAERGQEIQQAAEALRNAASSVEDAVNYLGEIV